MEVHLALRLDHVGYIHEAFVGKKCSQEVGTEALSL